MKEANGCRSEAEPMGETSLFPAVAQRLHDSFYVPGMYLPSMYQKGLGTAAAVRGRPSFYLNQRI